MTTTTEQAQFRGARKASVSVIIVNWNTADLLAQAVASLEASGAGDLVREVIVVDNGSTDGSLDLLSRCWPTVRQIPNATNRGYQAANNQGMAAASSEYLLLLNTDAMLQEGCLDRLVSWLASHPDAAIVGPRLCYGDGRFQRWTAGRSPSLGAAASYFFLLDHVFPASGLWLGRDVQRAFTPGWVSSACMLVRRSALTQIGPMDERFFAYMDDVDLCARAWAAGWRVWYLPGAHATHLMGGSTQAINTAGSPLALRALVRYFAMQHGPVATRSLQLQAATGFALRAVLHAALARARGRSLEVARQHWRNSRTVLEPFDKTWRSL